MKTKKKKKILIIEDERDILRTTQYALEGDGYEVYTAGDGEEGIIKLEQVRPDLLLLDLRLPGKHGFKIAQEIQENALYKDLPIIVFSAMTDEASKYIATKRNVVGFIEKPLDLDKLSFQIRDVLGDRT